MAVLLFVSRSWEFGSQVAGYGTAVLHDGGRGTVTFTPADVRSTILWEAWIHFSPFIIRLLSYACFAGAIFFPIFMLDNGFNMK